MNLVILVLEHKYNGAEVLWLLGVTNNSSYSTYKLVGSPLSAKSEFVHQQS